MALYIKKIGVFFLLTLSVVAIVAMLYTVFTEGKTIVVLVAFLYLVLCLVVLLRIGPVRRHSVDIQGDKILIREIVLGEVVESELIAWGEIIAVLGLVHISANKIMFLFECESGKMFGIDEDMQGWENFFRWFVLKIENYSDDWINIVKQSREPATIYLREK